MTSEGDLDQRTQEIRAAVAGLRAEVDRLHAQLGGVPSDPAAEELDARAQQSGSPPKDLDEKPEAEAAPSASPAGSEQEEADQPDAEAPVDEAESVVEEESESTDAGESPQAAAAEAAGEPEHEGSTAPEVEPGAEAEVVPERLVSKDDAELAKTYDLACAFLEDAESRRDQQAIAHWRSLAAAALEESARRPDFGEGAGSSKRLSGRRSRRLIAQLESARQLHLERTS
jgi:hypothetical protein